METEITRIVNFIREYMQEDEKVVIPVSGGIDSDVVARLCCRALGKDKIKLFIVTDNNMERKFLTNARNLAKDLEVSLTEIPLEERNIELIQILEEAEKDKIFNSKSLLDSNKIKCSMRSTIISCYQDKGYIIAGCTNRTEYELGFFVTFRRQFS